MTMTTSSNHHFVAIDMGSNSFHLVIAREQDGSLQILHKEKQPVQLAKGLNDKGELCQQAIDRGLMCLKEFAHRFSDLPEARVRPVATHTLRVATNAEKFIDAALEIMPYPIEIISGHEEARLIYSGIAQNELLSEKNLVIDIGGGSTEVIIGCHTTATHLSSLRCGCVSYNDRFFKNGELKRDYFRAAMTAADKQFATLSKDYFSGNWSQALGSSGSVKAIVQAIKETFGCDTITLNRLKRLKNHFIKLGHIDNIEFENIDEKRVPVLAAGLAILISFFRRLDVIELKYTQSALREGVLYELAEIDQDLDVRLRTVNSMAKLYHIDIGHANKVCNTALELYDHVSDNWQLGHYAHLLSYAALLHEIGIHINSRQHQRHGSYIIKNSDLPGFSEPLQQQLSLLIAFHRKKIDVELLETLEPKQQQPMVYLTCLIRLAVLFNLGREGAQFDFNHVYAEDNRIVFFLPKNSKKGSMLVKDLHREKKRLALIGIELVLY
ncbi:MAG: exopolyphosphatase [Parashewanella sp.]